MKLVPFSLYFLVSTFYTFHSGYTANSETFNIAHWPCVCVKKLFREQLCCIGLPHTLSFSHSPFIYISSILRFISFLVIMAIHTYGILGTISDCRNRVKCVEWTNMNLEWIFFSTYCRTNEMDGLM